jgi:tRNA-2-methylthio-N6-dimethylallyladenosine synthase
MEQVADDVKSERLLRLQALLHEQQTAFNAGMRGLVVDVLLEKPGKREGQLVGRTEWMQTVQVDAAIERIGEIVPVRVDHVGANTLFGTLMDENERVRAIA